MKKLFLFMLIAVACFGLTGCGNKNIEGSLEDIMEKVYADIDDEDKPMMLTNIELTDENIKDYRDDKLVSTSLKLSPMLEQIVAKDNQIYALFESNSKVYTKKQKDRFDSIPVIDANSLVKKLELKIDTN